MVEHVTHWVRGSNPWRRTKALVTSADIVIQRIQVIEKSLFSLRDGPGRHCCSGCNAHSGITGAARDGRASGREVALVTTGPTLSWRRMHDHGGCLW